MPGAGIPKTGVSLKTSSPSSEVPLESILCTEELRHRHSRPPDYEKENRALVKLVSALADSPGTILQTLAETILDVTHCDSAGLSLLTKDGKHRTFAARVSIGRLSQVCGIRTSVAGLRAISAPAETFSSAEEFLARPRARTPNCLVLDISLPDINGLELQKLIATDRTDIPTRSLSSLKWLSDLVSQPHAIHGAFRESLIRSAA